MGCGDQCECQDCGHNALLRAGESVDWALNVADGFRAYSAFWAAAAAYTAMSESSHAAVRSVTRAVFGGAR